MRKTKRWKLEDCYHGGGTKFDRNFVKNLLEENKYDGIIDYMLYKTHEFADRFQMILENTGHYIYLSSYSVYADDDVITEKSPRLLDVSDNNE